MPTSYYERLQCSIKLMISELKVKRVFTTYKEWKKILKGTVAPHQQKYVVFNLR